MLTTITSKGQITIPVEIRKKLGLHSGNKINFVLKKDKTVEMIPVDISLKSLKGIVTKPDKSVSIEEMNRVIGESHARN